MKKWRIGKIRGVKTEEVKIDNLKMWRSQKVKSKCEERLLQCEDCEAEIPWYPPPINPRCNCLWWKGVVILLLWGRQLLVLLSPHFLLALPFPFFVPLPFPLSHQVLYPHASCQLYLWTINASMVQSGRPILRVGWVPLAPCQKEKQVVEDFVTMAILSLQIGNKRR